MFLADWQLILLGGLIGGLIGKIYELKQEIENK